jgi:hypothetical protein
MGSETAFSGAFAQSRKAPITFVIPFRLSACMSAAPTGRISVQFDIVNFYENL